AEGLVAAEAGGADPPLRVEPAQAAIASRPRTSASGPVRRQIGGETNPDTLSPSWGLGIARARRLHADTGGHRRSLAHDRFCPQARHSLHSGTSTSPPPTSPTCCASSSVPAAACLSTRTS